MGELGAEPLLLLDQSFQAHLEIARYHPGDAVVIEPDELAQEWNWKQGLPPSTPLLLDNDLRQNRVGQVLAGLGIVHDKIPVGPYHRRKILQRHVRARLRIIETPVRVFLDDHRLFLVGGWVILAEHGGQIVALALFDKLAQYPG